MINTPKNLKDALEEEKKDVYLVNELRMKEIVNKHLYFLKNNHLFVDEIDTIRVYKLHNIRHLLATMTVCSANDYYLPFDSDFISINHMVTEKEVDAKIKLPDIIESKTGFRLGLTLKKIHPYVLDSIKHLIDTGDFKTLFGNYSVDMTRLDLLIGKIIEENLKKITEHQKLHQFLQNPTFLMKMRYNNQELRSILDSLWKDTDDVNCSRCFDIVKKHNLDKDLCKNCTFGKNNSSRIGVLDQILTAIDTRQGRAKKVLIYCSADSLVNELKEHLEKVNLWTCGLSGTSTQRAKTIDKYKKSDSDIYLVCNSIENSAGIHVPETTDIIIYHKLESRYDTQIIGRGQRLGRTDNMYLHRIEEFI